MATPSADPTSAVTEPADVAATPADDPTDGPDPGGDEVPVATFTQPYLPEESVVELRDEVPIEVPEDATDDETAVVRAYGQYYAVVEQVLKGVPFDDVDAASVATGERRANMRADAEEAVEQERVIVGPPVEIHLSSVEVDGDQAKLLTCLDPGESVRITSGEPTLVVELIEYETDLVVEDGRWKVAKTVTPQDAEPCEEVFE